MSRQRRQAHDFTDSLERFRVSRGDSTTDRSRETCQSFSEDSLNEILLNRADETARFRKHNHTSDSKSRSAKHSEILAGSSAKSSLVQDTFASCTMEYSASQDKPDLNKRINLFQNENLGEHGKGNNDVVRENKENADPQCPKKCASSLVEREVPAEINVLRENLSRDSNYNLQNKWQTQVENSAHTVFKEKNDSESKENKKQVDTVESCVPGAENQDTRITEFESILCTLDNKLNQIKETSQPQKVLKRLSNVYNHYPKKFTEELLTIIENSVVSSDDNERSNSPVDLSRLTAEFTKMCKFIEDESAPDWPSILMSPPTQNQKMNTPILSADKVKGPQSFLRRIAKNVFDNSPGSPHNLSVTANNSMTFEHLEAQCNRLYSNEEENHQPLQRSLSSPSLMNMSGIGAICEKQMAALNETENRDAKSVEQTPVTIKMKMKKHRSLEHFSPLQQLQEHNNSRDWQHKGISYAKRKSRRISIQAEADQMQTDKSKNVYMTISPAELEKTLLQGIAEKRKRCLNTAKLIMEINANAGTVETQKPMLRSNNEPNYSNNNEAEFLNTLMSCKKYHTYLTKQKPLLDLLQGRNSTSPEPSFDQINSKQVQTLKTQKPLLKVEKSPRTKRDNINIYSPNPKSPNMYKSPLSHKSPLFNLNNRKTTNINQTEKPKLFLTPGKSPTSNNYKKKRVYFPNMETALKTTPVKNTIRSPHADRLCRLDYNTVISPVGQYIRGTDVQLIKNIKSNTDGLLLTSEKKMKASPARSGNSKQKSYQTQKKSPLEKGIFASQCSTPLSQKILTPKLKKVTPTTSNQNTPVSHFVLPKVSYKLPLEVRMIKNKEIKKTGSRIKSLLESAQNKVVIRHGERPNTVHRKGGAGSSYDDDEILVINYNPQDASVHVEQAASKTNFIRQPRKA